MERKGRGQKIRISPFEYQQKISEVDSTIVRQKEIKMRKELFLLGRSSLKKKKQKS